LRQSGVIGDDSRVDADLNSAAFPDEAARLRALLAERDAVIAERDAALAERDAHLLNARYEIEKLKVLLAALRRERYGKSSERLATEIGQLEMLIGDLEEDQAERDAAAAEKAPKTEGKPDRRANRLCADHCRSTCRVRRCCTSPSLPAAAAAPIPPA
jgi:DNA repair exonuclease SbcCD ATPase subunit